jgi:hypothetical protein
MAATTRTSIQIRSSAFTVLSVNAASRSQNMPAMITAETATSRVRLAAMPA